MAFNLGFHAVGLLDAPPAGPFVEEDVYAYKYADEMCTVAHWAGEYEASLAMGLRVLNGNRYPVAKEDRLWANAKFAAAKLGLRPRVQVPTAPLDLRAVDIRWINVRGRAARAARTSALLGRLGLGHAVRFEAVTGIAPEKTCPPFKRNYRSIAESHCRVLEATILETGRPVLVLEDDVAVEDEGGAAERLRALPVPGGCAAFYLGVNRNDSMAKIVAREMGEGVLRVRNVLGTHAILYTSPDFARTVVAQARRQMYKETHTALDDLIAWQLSRTNRVYAATPPLFYQDDPAKKSSERLTRAPLDAERL